MLKRKYREGIYSGECSGAASGSTDGSDASKKAKVESAADAAEPMEDVVIKDAVPAGVEAASGTEQEPAESDEKSSPENTKTVESGQEAAAADADIAETEEQATGSSASVASDDAVFVDAMEQQPAAKEDTEACPAAEEEESVKETSPIEMNAKKEASPSTEGSDSVFTEAASEAESLPSPDDVAKAAVEAAMTADVGEEKETDSNDGNDALETPVKQTVSIHLVLASVINRMTTSCQD